MGKLPGILLAIVVIWLGWKVVHDGPANALGGLGGLLGQPQYGEADRATRSGGLSDRILGDGDASGPPTD